MFLVVVGVCGYYLGKQSNNSLGNNISPTVTQQVVPTIKLVACTADAKQCPDGSWVSRVPPNCEFLPCPQQSLNP